MRPPGSLMLAVLVALVALGRGGVPPALGADCGTGVGLCRCGDRVVTTTRFSAPDPVLRAPCACDGITVASDVTLDIAGTIKGDGNIWGFCTGVRIESDASNVIVRNGGVEGFGFGVLGEFGADVRVSGIHAVGNGEGIHVEGASITVDGNIVRNNLQGILVAGWPEGAEIVVRSNRVDSNGLGVYVIGGTGGFRVSGNVASANVVGFVLDNGPGGPGPFTVEFNRATGNGWVGFDVSGEDIQVVGNVSTRNGWAGEILLMNGFNASCVRCRFSQNRRSYNEGFGIRDVYGNASDNVYTNNRCTGNALGSSDPSGLCQ